MNWGRLIFALVLPPLLSACMGTCNCSDVPPNWDYFADLETNDVYDEDAGQYLSSPPIQCTATLVGNSNTITFVIDGATCTKTGGDQQPTSPSCRLSYFSVDGASVTQAELSLRLTATDEGFLGGLQFQLDFSCNANTQISDSAYANGAQAFETRACGD